MSKFQELCPRGLAPVLANYWCRNRGWWHVKVSRLEQRPGQSLTHMSWLSCHCLSHQRCFWGQELRFPRVQILLPSWAAPAFTPEHLSFPLLVSKQLPRAPCRSHPATAMASSGILLGWCSLTCGCFFGLPLFLFRPWVSVDEMGFSGPLLLMLAPSSVCRL